jgi:hypothetical protein
MRLFGIPQVEDKKIAIAAALTYWVFRCRDKSRTPAMGVKTWEYLRLSLTNAVIPSKTLEDFIENLCNKLIVAHLRPQEWTWIISPNQRIQRVKETGEILEFDADQFDEKLRFESWRSLMLSLAPEGISDRHVLQTIYKYPHIICTYTRLRFEEDRAIGKSEFEEEEAIEVESYAP